MPYQLCCIPPDDGSNKVIDRINPTASMKAVKNDVEIENEKRAHIKDGVAMTKLFTG